TLPRVTLPRVVARGLQPTPFRQVAPAPHATPQTETSSEPAGSVTQVSGRARARTLPRAPGMTTLTDYQAARPARPKLALVQALAFRPRDRERTGRRLLNFVVAAVGLVLPFPVMLVIAALTKLTSPEQPTIFVYLREQIEGYQRRQRVRPGITGWAQVNQGYDTTVGDVRRKVGYDLEYIRRQSVFEDLRIMLRTAPVMLLRRGGW